MQDTILFVIEEGRLYAKSISEILGDLSAVANIDENLASDKLNDFFIWSLEYIDSREWEVAPDQGYCQDYLCPLYNIGSYGVLPIHINEDVLEAMTALEEV